MTSPTSSTGRRAEPVRWLAPRQLLRTASAVVKAHDFTRLADARVWGYEAPARVHDLTKVPPRDPDGQFTIDYMADTGDGFNGSFAVAASVNGHTGLKPADLLTLGGDLVLKRPRFDAAPV